MTSWSRRLEAADRKPGLASRPAARDLLADATDAGVGEDAMAGLRALVAVARDREGFRQRVVVRGTHEGEPGDLTFEVAHVDGGAAVRNLGPLRSAATGGGAEPPADGEEDDGGHIVQILTDTLVETPDLVAVFSSVGHEAMWANDAFATVIPVRAEDKVWLVELLDEWSKGHYEVKVLPALVKYGRWRGRLTLMTGEGERHVSVVIVAHRDKRGEIEAVSMVARDTVDAPADDGAEDLEKARFAALVESASELIAVASPEGAITWASPAALRLMGRTEDDVEGFNALDLVHPDDRPESLLDLVRPDDQGVGVPVDVRLQVGDTTRHLEVIVTDLTENPVIGGIVLNARDITERVLSTQALAERAYTDALTGLPNRMRLLDRAAKALQDAPEAPLGVLILDLDRFESANELHGQEAGDEVLRQVADRLAAEVREPAVVARHSGDQFVVLVPGQGDRAELLRLANRLRTVVALPVAVGDASVEVTTSVGVLVGAGVDEPEQLLRDATRALAHAKDEGGDRVEVFTDELAAVASRRQTMEQHLRQALDNDGIDAHYQPIVDLASGDVVAAEALLRVHDSGGQLLNPAELIEAAESSGLMTRVGLSVLQATAEQLAAWSDVEGAPGEVSVNISPKQLADPDLPSRVGEVLRSAGVPPEKLLLEITESILISQHPTVDAAISYLRALGVRIGLDDFGAGKSSLGYLKRFPLDFVKIDRSLVAGLGVDEQDTAIVRATIELAQNLGLEVVAVGVETEEQREILELLGCQRAQGYLFAPPAPAGDLTTG